VGIISGGRVCNLDDVRVCAFGVCVCTVGDVCAWAFSGGQDCIGAGRVYTVTGVLVSPIISGLMCTDDVARVRMITCDRVFINDKFCDRTVVVARVIWVCSIVVVFGGCYFYL
jgi:hypothetical protein